MNELVQGGRDQLEQLFSELADELAPAGVGVDVLLVGGSWMLWHGHRDATREVDSAHRIPPAAHAAIERVARRHDLSATWLNDNATPF